MIGFFWDLVTIAGVAVLLAGVAFVHVPAALIAGGLVLIALGLVGAWNATRHTPPAGFPDKDASADDTDLEPPAQR